MREEEEQKEREGDRAIEIRKQIKSMLRYADISLTSGYLTLDRLSDYSDYYSDYYF